MAIYAYHLANSYSGNTQPISHHTVYKYHHYNELKVLKGHIKMCFCKHDSTEKPSAERWDLV